MIDDTSSNFRIKLRDILVNHFSSEELKALCIEFGIQNEVLLDRVTSKTVAEEIVGYFKRRMQSDELIAYIKKNRPNVPEIQSLDQGNQLLLEQWLRKLNFARNPSMEEIKTSDPQVSEGHPSNAKDAKLFGLNSWLKEWGFSKNPFLNSALCAEQDDVEGFLELPMHQRIRSLSQTPFVLSSSGSGKTSLYQHIELEFDEALVNPHSECKILAITYTPDLIFSKVVDSHVHVRQIALLVQSKIQNLLKNKLALEAEPTFIYLTKTLREQYQIEGLFIMVDLNSFDSISQTNSLITKIGILNMGDIFFRFFVPMNLLELVRAYGWPIDKFPVHILHWQSEDLAMLLSHRLQLCRDKKDVPFSGDLNVTDAVENAKALLSNICDRSSLDKIIEKLIGLGEDEWQLRDMLRLGCYLLEEHFRGVNGRYLTDLIKVQSLDIALKRLKREKEFLS